MLLHKPNIISIISQYVEQFNIIYSILESGYRKKK